jgi:hypothetical protein
MGYTAVTLFTESENINKFFQDFMFVEIRVMIYNPYRYSRNNWQTKVGEDHG